MGNSIIVRVCMRLIFMLANFFFILLPMMPLPSLSLCHCIWRLIWLVVPLRIRANMNLFALYQLNGWKATPNFWKKNERLTHIAWNAEQSTFQRATTGKVLQFDKANFSPFLSNSHSFSRRLLFSKSAQLLFHFDIQRPPWCSHINFRICSLHRWYATIFLLAVPVSVSLCFYLYSQFFLLFSPYTVYVFFRLLRTCYMKGEMKCRSCTHVHAHTT